MISQADRQAVCPLIEGDGTKAAATRVDHIYVLMNRLGGLGSKLRYAEVYV